MRKLVGQFVKYPFYANLIIAFLVIAGLASIMAMKKSFMPELTSRNIYVSVYYPGASPTEMEEGVTSRIEEACRGIVGIKEITSTSSENSTSVKIETTGEYDIDETLMDVKNAVDGISSMPSAAERPIVYKQRSSSMALYISFSGDVSLETLKKHAQSIEEDFLASGIISQVTVFGYPDLEISVEAKEQNLLRYGLTFDDLIRAISTNNQDVSGGMIRSTEEEVLVRLRSRSSDPNKIGNIIVRGSEEGGIVRLNEVATVKRKFADVSSLALRRGQPVVSMMVNKLNTEDLEEITDFVVAYEKEFNKKNTGVEMEMAFSFMEILQSRLSLLLSNGITGLILVVIVLAMFLNVRLSLWVAWGIPSSFLAMFIAGELYGITINMFSLFGMILVIGILVDDGIVIGENIYQHFEKGKTPRKAAVDGTLEVMPAVITSVTTTIIAFMPFLFLKNQMEQMKEMAIVVILSLFFSLFEAFFVLPAHLANERVLNAKYRNEKPKGIKRYLEGAIVWLRDRVYGRALTLLMEYRYIVIGFPIALLMITVGMLKGSVIKSTVFPAMEFDSFSINMAFTPGSGEARTMEYLKKFEEIVWEANSEILGKHPNAFDDIEETFWTKMIGKEVDTTKTIVDNTYVNLGSAFSGQEVGAHAGSIDVYPRDLEGTGISSYEMINLVREKIGEVPELAKLTIAGQNMFGMPVSVSLLGKDAKELSLARDYLVGELSKMPELKDIIDNNALGKQEVQLRLKPKAYSLGLTENDVMNQVRQGFYGGQAQRLQEGRDELRVWVRYPKEDRKLLGQLENMRIKTPQGIFPLIELAEYDINRGPVSIKRYNSQREIRVDADIVDPDESVTEILAKVGKEMVPQMKTKYPGVTVVYQGQQKESMEAMQIMGTYFTIAFFIIIMILMIHFKSFKQPILILVMIPLAVLGAIWGHGIHGKPVSMLSVFGIIALTGVIINDAVVFISRYNDLLLEGYQVKEAIREAGKSRLRAIILTTLTTSIGLYPLILEKSFQAQFLIPMAISLAYGVAFGTMFILIFLPSLILLLNDYNRAKVYVKSAISNYIETGELKGDMPTRESVEIAIVNNDIRIEGDDKPKVSRMVSDIDLED